MYIIFTSEKKFVRLFVADSSFTLTVSIDAHCDIL